MTLSAIFSFVIVVGMFLSFFSLIVSMARNTIHKAKEIGLLRSIGYTKVTIQRILFLEALTLVLSSSILGLISGTIMGYLLAM